MNDSELEQLNDGTQGFRGVLRCILYFLLAEQTFLEVTDRIIEDGGVCAFHVFFLMGSCSSPPLYSKAQKGFPSYYKA